MNPADRARLELAVQSFDHHLEMRGACRARRRELSHELRANLAAATAHDGVSAALDGIGSPKALAVQMSESNQSKPRWQAGLFWSMAVLTAVVFLMLWTSIIVIQAVQASGVEGRVDAHVVPWWGSTFIARVDGDGSIVGMGIGVAWPVLVLPLLAFVVAARPWRSLRRSEGGT